jgi:hypothetical protein
MFRAGLVAIWSLLVFAVVRADEPVSLENVRDPGPNRLDEPIAKQHSLDRAMRFLDSAALTWQKERQCFTCHTNFAHLYARPLGNRSRVG